MGFKQLGWFPTSAASYVEVTISPQAVNQARLYPGDTFVNNETGQVFCVTETSLGPMSDSARVFVAPEQRTRIFRKPELEDLLETTVRHQRALAYGNVLDEETNHVFHLFIGHTDAHEEPEANQFHAWWGLSKPGDPLVETPTTIDQDAAGVIAPDFKTLRRHLTYRELFTPADAPVEYFDQVPEVADMIDRVVAEAETNAANRLDEDTLQASGNAHSADREKPHKDNRVVPTLAGGQSLRTPGNNHISPCDRLFLHSQDGITPLPDLSRSAVLDTAEHMVVTRCDPDATEPSVAIHHAFENTTFHYTPEELDDLIEMTRQGGYYLRCLARDAYIEALAETPTTYSLHVYQVRVGEEDSHFLVAATTHESDKAKLEHPYAMSTTKFDNADVLLNALRNPERGFANREVPLDDWVSHPRATNVIERVADSVEEVGLERGLLTER